MSTPLPLRVTLVLAVASMSTAVAIPASASPAAWTTGYPDATLVANMASPDGSKVFATGFTGGGSTQKFLTIGYNATTGEQLGSELEKKGTVKVTSVQEKYGKAKCDAPVKGMKVGDIVKAQ